MFPIQMTFTVSTPAELAKLVAATGGATLPVVDTSAPKTEAAKQEGKKPDPKPEAPAAASAVPPAATQDTQGQTDAASGDKVRTIDEAKALTMKIVADKGRDAAVKLLTEYGVPVAAKLQANQVAAFCTDAEKVLAS